MKSENIFETGGAGFTDTNLKNNLQKQVHDFLAINLYDTEREIYTRIDIRKYRQIKRVEIREWDIKTRLLLYIIDVEKKLGYKPKMKFKNGLKNTYQVFVDNWTNIEKRVAEF